MRAARSLRARQDRSSPAPTPPSTCRGSSPTTSRRSRPARAATRRCSTARATCRPTCGCCGSRDGGDLARHSSPRRSPAVLAPPEDVQDRPRGRDRGRDGEERAILSLIGPRSAEIAGTAGRCPSTPRALSRRRGSSASRVGTARRRRPDRRRRRRRAACARALLAAGAVEVGAEAAEIAPDRGRHAPLRRRDEHRDDAGRGRASSSAPSASPRAATSARRPVARLHYKGKPNRHLRGLRLSAPAEPGAALRLGEKEVGTLGSAAVSPALGPIALAIVRREAEPGAELP